MCHMHAGKSNVLMRVLLLLALASTVFARTLMAQTLFAQTLTHWTRPANGPVIAPNPASVFSDPVTGAQTHWEALHTFNPAAVVRDGHIVVLYRAEDDSGPDSIGMHVS